MEVARTGSDCMLRCLKVISVGLLLEGKTKLKFHQPYHTVPYFVRGDIFRHFSFFIYLPSSSPSPSPPTQPDSHQLPPCHLAHSRLHCPVLFFIQIIFITTHINLF